MEIHYHAGRACVIFFCVGITLIMIHYHAGGINLVVLSFQRSDPLIGVRLDPPNAFKMKSAKYVECDLP
jgi:hypothetical protein